MWRDAEVGGGDLGPHVVRPPRRVRMEPDLEQRPGRVEGHTGVAAAQRFRNRNRGRAPQPARLPGRFGDIERHELGQRLGQRVRGGPVGERRPSPERRDVDGVARLVDQLGELTQPAIHVAGEDRRRSRRPRAVRAQGWAAAERGERDGHRGPAGPGRGVELHVQRVEVGTQRGVQLAVDPEHAVQRQRVAHRSIRRAGEPPPVPGLDRATDRADVAGAARLAVDRRRRRDGVSPRLQGRDDPRLDVMDGHAQRDGIGGDGGAAPAPQVCGRGQQRPIRRSLAGVAVDHPPQRLEREEQAPPGGRRGLGREPAEDPGAGQRRAFEREPVRQRAVAAIEAAMELVAAALDRHRPGGGIVAGPAVDRRRDGQACVIGEGALHPDPDRGACPAILRRERRIVGRHALQLAPQDRLGRGRVGFERSGVGWFAARPRNVEPVPGVAGGEVCGLERVEGCGGGHRRIARLVIGIHAATPDRSRPGCVTIRPWS